MFCVALDNSKTWKQIVDAVARFLTEAHFQIKNNGISLVQYDWSLI
jgi:hypothetical protein